MTAPIFIDTAAVAALLGQDAGQFLRIRAGLEDNHGFPLPVPHWRRPLKWRRDQVEGWLASQGRPRAEMARDMSGPIPLGGNVVRLIDHARRT